MTYSEPARTAGRRTRSTGLVVGFAGFALVLAATAFAAARHLPNDKHGTYLPLVQWPSAAAGAA